jgi:hypothetical protein
MKSLKLVALIFLVGAILFSCTKKKEMSQEERERSEPLAANQFIENEHGGIRFFIVNGQAEMKSSIPVFTTEPLANYYLEVDKLPENSTTEIWFVASGTFNLEVEGFTAPPDGIGKRWKVSGLTASTRITVQKGIVRYTFNLK